MATAVAIVLSVLALSFIWGTAAFWRIQAKSLETYEKYMGEFYASIQPLLKEDDIPSVGLELIRFLNARIGDPYVARGLLFAIKSGQIGAEPSPGARRRMEALDAFSGHKPELKSSLERALMNWLYAVSFLDWFWGPFLRLWLAAVDTPRRQEAIAVEYNEITEHPHTALPKAVAA